VTCTGDVSTAVALLVAREFTDKVLYCEPYTFESDSGRLVVGSCGIGNLAMAGGSPPLVCSNYAYVGREAPGACVRFGLPKSAATMLGLAPRGVDEGGRARLLWATGETSPRCTALTPY
jgi:hypothetical protein